MELSNDAKEFLIKKGTNLDFGARPLRRALENYVEDPLAEELLNGSFQGKNRIVVEANRDDDGKIKHLKFQGSYVEPEEPDEPEEPVGVGAGDSDDNGGEGDKE